MLKNILSLLFALLFISPAFTKNIEDCIETKKKPPLLFDSAIKKCLGILHEQGGGKLHFPAGNYSIAETIMINRPGVILIGEGRATKITYQGNKAAIAFYPKKNGNVSWGGVRDLAIHHKNKKNSATAIKVLPNEKRQGNYNMNFSGLWVKNFHVGMALSRVFSSVVESSSFENSPVELSEGGVALTFLNVWFRKVPKDRFAVRTKNSKNKANAIGSAGGQMSIQFIGSNFDAPRANGQAIYINSSWPLVIEGCNFEDFSKPPIVLSSWGDTSIRYSSFMNIKSAAIFLESPANSGSGQGKTIMIQGLRAPKRQIWIDENNQVKRGGEIVVLDKSIDFTRDTDLTKSGLQGPVRNNTNKITVSRHQ